MFWNHKNFMKLKLKTQHCNLISHQNAANRFPNFSKYMQLQAIAVWPAYLVMHRTIKISPTLAAGYIPNQQQSSLFMWVAQRWSVRKHGKNPRPKINGTKRTTWIDCLWVSQINHLSDFKESPRWRAFRVRGGWQMTNSKWFVVVPLCVKFIIKCQRFGGPHAKLSPENLKAKPNQTKPNQSKIELRG